MVVCVPVTLDGQVGRSWGRADRVAVAEIAGSEVVRWQEIDVRWDVLHEEGTEGSHHARVARFLIDQKVDQVVSGHMGPGMQQMLAKMGLTVRVGASGDARSAVVSGIDGARAATGL
jgi:predicted Fe-Mo cluster-binding NifX family protein